MKSKPIFIAICTVLTPFVSHLLAQEGDVCCLMSKISGDSVDVRALGTSASECKPGGTSGEYRICSGNPDPSNSCPSMSAEAICRACGYHWTGNSCLVEDPVKKAKQQMKEEDEREKAKKKNEKIEKNEKPKAPSK